MKGRAGCKLSQSDVALIYHRDATRHSAFVFLMRASFSLGDGTERKLTLHNHPVILTVNVAHKLYSARFTGRNNFLLSSFMVESSFSAPCRSLLYVPLLFTDRRIKIRSLIIECIETGLIIKLAQASILCLLTDF